MTIQDVTEGLFPSPENLRFLADAYDDAERAHPEFVPIVTIRDGLLSLGVCGPKEKIQEVYEDVGEE